MVYALHEAERDAMRASVVTRALALDGVDLVMWLERDAHDAPREAVIASPDRGELRFAPEGAGGNVKTRAGSNGALKARSPRSTAHVEDGSVPQPPTTPTRSPACGRR